MYISLNPTCVQNTMRIFEFIDRHNKTFRLRGGKFLPSYLSPLLYSCFFIEGSCFKIFGVLISSILIISLNFFNKSFFSLQKCDIL